jgi:phytoene dehydrogenase-like protein
MGPWTDRWETVFTEILTEPHFPRHPFLMAGFGLRALRSVEGLAARFKGKLARGLLAGLGGHSFLPFDATASAAIALVLGIAGHAVGWPIVEGGSRNLTRAMAKYFESLGGTIQTGTKITRAEDVPAARSVFLNLTIPQVLALLGEKLPSGYRRTLERWKLGPGVFKIDFALSGPIPWKSAAVSQAGTMHLGGSLEEVAAYEKAVSQGTVTDRPFLLASQPTAFDPTRAPAGKHTAWAYCHVPRGSDVDMTEAILAQIERFAPGFRSLILKQHVMTPRGFERHNSSLIGGDISGGLPTLAQVLRRPVALSPYALPLKNWYLCSSSTPPGSGVHGFGGFNAATAALRGGA